MKHFTQIRETVNYLRERQKQGKLTANQQLDLELYENGTYAIVSIFLIFFVALLSES